MSIVKLTKSDTERVLEYVNHEPEMNLFFIGDIENFGIDVPPVSLYASEGSSGEWDSLMLRYRDYWLLYSTKEDYDARAAAEFLQNQPMDCLSGKTSLLERILPYFPDWSLQSDYMCRLTSVSEAALRETEDGVTIRALTEDDVDEYIALMCSCEEFSKSYQGEGMIEKRREETIAKMREEKSSITAGLFIGDKLISAAGTSADNSQSTMITGVATRLGYRNKGFATAVVGWLCRESLLSGKKYLCLFYDNPVAGRIYRRIGFTEMGEYAMMRKVNP